MYEILRTATFDEIMSNYSCYYEMIKLMTQCDRKAPIGSCCGKYKEKHINQFIAERDKYIGYLDKIASRKIKPLWSGNIYFAKIGKYYNSEYIDDVTSLSIIKLLEEPDKYFDLTKYTENEEKTEEVKEEVTTKKTTTKKKSSKK